MGQSQPLYCLQNLETLQYSDLQPVRYLWVDRNIQNKQNQLYFNRFIQHFSIEGFFDLTSLKNYVESVTAQGKLRVRAICSASLDDDVYRYIQTKLSIDRAMLFCGNKTKASILMRDYPKIKLACFSYPQVIRTVKQWVREQTQSIYFFNLQQIHKLNLAVANWRAFTEINANTPQCFQDFIKMAQKLFVLKSQIKNFAKKAEQAQKTASPFWFLDYVIDNQYFLNQVNTMLKSTKDPTKLAYVRWPTHTLFNSIKKFYQANSKNKQHENPTYYGSIELSELQKARLKKNEYVCINQFILTTTKDCYKQNDKNTVYIKVEVINTGNVCNGFYCSQRTTVFNLGNYYKVQQYSKNLLTLELVTLSDQKDITITDVVSGILLNQARAEKMEIIKQGQWYSLFLSGKLQQANDYISRVNELKRKNKKETQDIIRWGIAREKVKCDNGRSVVVSIKRLEQMLPMAQLQQKILIYLAMAEIYIFNKEFQKFSKVLTDLQNSIPKNASFYQQTISNFKLFKKWNEFLNCSTPESKVEQLLKYCSQLEKQLLQFDKTNYFNKTYLFCLFIASCCHQKMSQYDNQIYELNRILALLSWTEGRQSYEFKLMSNYKFEAFRSFKKSDSEKQLEIRKKLRTNDALIEKLLDKDVPLRIEISSLDMQLFD